MVSCQGIDPSGIIPTFRETKRLELVWDKFCVPKSRPALFGLLDCHVHDELAVHDRADAKVPSCECYRAIIRML